MKVIKAAVFALAGVALAGVLAQPARADVSFEFAYSNLNQHGSWLVSGEYGRVWQPREYTREWNPYHDGHWVDTDMGWAWVSDYQWGSLPYHYGTWVVDPRYGWVWIPGEVWAPSWVVFRTGPDHIGWAPVPPGFSVGVSIGFAAPSSFIYVSSRDFLAPDLRRAIIPPSQTNVFINNTTIVNNIVIQNNIVINRGPDVQIIEKASGHSVRRQSIEGVARVAPFEHVSRAELAVSPERMKRGLRVAEPVPESRALPASDKHDSPSDQGKKGAKSAAPAPPAASAPPPPAVKDKANASPRHAPRPSPAASAPQPPAAKDKSNAREAPRPSPAASAPQPPAAKDKANARRAPMPSPAASAPPRPAMKDKANARRAPMPPPAASAPPPPEAKGQARPPVKSGVKGKKDSQATNDKGADDPKK